MIVYCALLLSDCQGVQVCRRQQHDMDNKKGPSRRDSPVYYPKCKSGYSFTGSWFSGSSACG